LHHLLCFHTALLKEDEIETGESKDEQKDCMSKGVLKEEDDAFERKEECSCSRRNSFHHLKHHLIISETKMPITIATITINAMNGRSDVSVGMIVVMLSDV